MGSADKKRKEMKAKKAAGRKGGSSTPSSNGNSSVVDLAKQVDEVLGQHHAPVISERSTTGVLASRPLGKDVRIEQFTLSCYGKLLISDATIEINHGNRYGLLGRNGTGKSTFLKCLAAREVPIPDHIDIYHLDSEDPPSDLTAVNAVIESVKKELERLETLSDEILERDGPDSELLQPLYDRMEEMDPSTFEKRASEILFGLGFTPELMKKATKDMSGGWRMRVALARALFLKPTLLLLDEPTNHLDLGACVWLEDYLSTYNRMLIIVSHSQDFLNGVCTNIMLLRDRQLQYWGGNYDTYIRTRTEQEKNQMMQYKKQQEEIKHLKDFISSCGTYSNLVRQAKSKQKIIDKMEAAGLIQPVLEDVHYNFKFPPCANLAAPVVAFSDVAFAYSGNKCDYLYSDLNLGVDLDSRIALVGPNGVGKSTLLKLILGDITPTEGMIRINSHLQIGRYHQHSADALEEEKSPLEYMMTKFKHVSPELTFWRSQIGRYGLSGDTQTAKISTLSDGMKSRLVFAEIAARNPNMLLLDEPTNHLDIESIDSLADAVNAFEGGLLFVSHDFRLIDQVAKEIWVLDEKKITPWKTNIRDYKDHLRKDFERQAKKHSF